MPWSKAAIAKAPETGAKSWISLIAKLDIKASKNPGAWDLRLAPEHRHTTGLPRSWGLRRVAENCFLVGLGNFWQLVDLGEPIWISALSLRK